MAPTSARRSRDHELHIYGTGKDRREIVARYGEQTAPPAADDATEATPATGGAAAPAGLAFEAPRVERRGDRRLAAQDEVRHEAG